MYAGPLLSRRRICLGVSQWIGPRRPKAPRIATSHGHRRVLGAKALQAAMPDLPARTPGSCRVASEAPTDPDMRIFRIRLVRSRVCCAWSGCADDARSRKRVSFQQHAHCVGLRLVLERRESDLHHSTRAQLAVFAESLRQHGNHTASIFLEVEAFLGDLWTRATLSDSGGTLEAVSPHTRFSSTSAGSEPSGRDCGTCRAKSASRWAHRALQ